MRYNARGDVRRRALQSDAEKGDGTMSNRRQYRGMNEQRRRFLKGTAAVGAATVGGGFDWLGQLPHLDAAELCLPEEMVRFTDDIEPLVRMLEETPREQVLETVAQRVKQGRVSYRELLAALLLAGIRNVQPRPSVGFKFHAVLVVNSCHLASLASADADRWLPLFWGIDNFKSSQARDVNENDWTMAPVDEAKVPSGDKARQAFIDAMEAWDVDAADVAAAGIARALPSHEILELLARFAARDFRSIGHKAIYVANAYRTLNCIGWRFAEPVVRSLAYALLNHEGEPNPATSDLRPDRPWRLNLERIQATEFEPAQGRIDGAATMELVKALRTESFDDASQLVEQQLGSGVAMQSIQDALFLSSGEMLMRQPGIVGLHTLTTSNAMYFLSRTCMDPQTRHLLLLQHAAFATMFRDEMTRRGQLRELWVDELAANTKASEEEDAMSKIFDSISRDRLAAARQVMSLPNNAEEAEDFMREARRLVFMKGSDSHDYKFSSAVLEDYYHLSPAWRQPFLATSVFHLRGAGERDLSLVDRIQAALS